MLVKLQHNFLKIILIMGLLVIEGPLFSQTTEQGIDAPVAANPTTNPTIPSETERPTEAPQEEHNTEDLEKLLKKYNTDSEKILDDTAKLHNIQEGAAKSEVNDKEMAEIEVAATAQKPNDSLEQVFNPAKPKELPTDLSNSVRMALEPLQQLSEAELLKRMDENTKGTTLRVYMDRMPNIAVFAVRLVKDKESVPSLVKIVENKKRLIRFAAAMLCTIIFGMMLKKGMHKEGRPFLKSVLYFFLRTYFLLAIRIGVIYYFFGTELAPAAKVFKKTFM